MAINLADKYSSKIAEKFTQESIVAGKCSKEWDFSGVKSIKIYTPQTVELVNYSRSGLERYGTPTEMEDTVQEMTMTQDKSFAMTIDKGNNTEQMMIKNAGKMMNLQLKERVVPLVDKYALSVFAHKAGKIFKETAAITKSNIFAAVCEAETYMTDNFVPTGERYLYISGKNYNLLRQSDEFIKVNETINAKAIEKGVVGEVVGFKVVKVPTSYLPAGVNFIACYKNAVLMPYKIKDNKIHTDPPGISGALLEGRNLFDAFVIGQRANGVYVSVDSTASIATAPTVSTEGTIGGSGTIYYTVDGSDPRYSESRKLYVDTVEGVASKVTIKAYAEGSGDAFPSGVVETTIE